MPKIVEYQYTQKDYNQTSKRYLVRGQLREVYVVTEWKGGCIYRTKRLGFVVCDSSHECVRGNGLLTSPSTRFSRGAYDR